MIGGNGEHAFVESFGLIVLALSFQKKGEIVGCVVASSGFSEPSVFSPIAMRAA